MTHTQYKILEFFFYRGPAKTVGTQELFEQIWPNPDISPEDERNVLVAHIKDIRRRIVKTDIRLVTHWWIGYELRIGGLK